MMKSTLLSRLYDARSTIEKLIAEVKATVDAPGIDERVALSQPAFAGSRVSCSIHQQNACFDLGLNIFDFLSPVPAGYDTVLGYLAKNDPQTLSLIEDVCEGTRRDGFWLANRAAGQQISVPAPKALRDCHKGIQYVNAYPLWLLARRLGQEVA